MRGVMAKPTRDERLASALRANLRKRKGQGLEEAAPDAVPAPSPDVSPSAPAEPRS